MTIVLLDRMWWHFSSSLAMFARIGMCGTPLIENFQQRNITKFLFSRWFDCSCECKITGLLDFSLPHCWWIFAVIKSNCCCFCFQVGLLLLETGLMDVSLASHCTTVAMSGSCATMLVFKMDLCFCKHKWLAYMLQSSYFWLHVY